MHKRIGESTLWNELVEKLDHTPGQTRKQIAENLNERDVPDLIAVLESGSENEQHATLTVLVDALLGVLLFPAPPKQGILAPYETKLCDVAERLAQNLQIPDYCLTAEELREEIRQKKRELPLNNPKNPDTATRAFTLLTQLDKDRALRFVLSSFDYESLSERKREYVIGLISGCCGTIPKNDGGSARLQNA